MQDRQDKPICFVISPIGEVNSDTRRRADTVLDFIIAPVVSDNYTILRADEIAQPGLITSQIVSHLISAPIVIADLTDRNPNVFYELAIRHATRNPVILLDEGPIETLPFDITGMRVIPLSRTLPQSEHCKATLRAYIEAIEANTYTADSPISVGVDIIEVRGVESAQASIAQKLIDVGQEIRWLSANIFEIRDALNRAPIGQLEMADGMLALAEGFESINDDVAQRLAQGYRKMALGYKAMLEDTQTRHRGDSA